MKKLFLTVLAGLSLATIAANRAHATLGETCVDSQGRSGYMISTGRMEVCDASAQQ